jgi:hypothetical protein
LVFRRVQPGFLPGCIRDYAVFVTVMKRCFAVERGHLTAQQRQNSGGRAEGGRRKLGGIAWLSRFNVEVYYR